MKGVSLHRGERKKDFPGFIGETFNAGKENRGKSLRLGGKALFLSVGGNSPLVFVRGKKRKKGIARGGGGGGKPSQSAEERGDRDKRHQDLSKGGRGRKGRRGIRQPKNH